MQTMERQSVAPVHPKSRRPAPWPVAFYRSAVGKKWVMALTGIISADDNPDCSVQGDRIETCELYEEGHN